MILPVMMEHLLLQFRKYSTTTASATASSTARTGTGSRQARTRTNDDRQNMMMMMMIFQIRPHQRRKLCFFFNHHQQKSTTGISSIGSSSSSSSSSSSYNSNSSCFRIVVSPTIQQRTMMICGSNALSTRRQCHCITTEIQQQQQQQQYHYDTATNRTTSSTLSSSASASASASRLSWLNTVFCNYNTATFHTHLTPPQYQKLQQQLRFFSSTNNINNGNTNTATTTTTTTNNNFNSNIKNRNNNNNHSNKNMNLNGSNNNNTRTNNMNDNNNNSSTRTRSSGEGRHDRHHKQRREQQKQVRHTQQKKETLPSVFNYPYIDHNLPRNIRNTMNATTPLPPLSNTAMTGVAPSPTPNTVTAAMTNSGTSPSSSTTASTSTTLIQIFGSMINDCFPDPNNHNGNGNLKDYQHQQKQPPKSTNDTNKNDTRKKNCNRSQGINSSTGISGISQALLQDPHAYYSVEHNVNIDGDENFITELISVVEGDGGNCHAIKNDTLDLLREADVDTAAIAKSSSPWKRKDGSNRNKPKIYPGWTSVFICPISGTHYPSGTLYKSDANDTTQQHQRQQYDDDDKNNATMAVMDHYKNHDQVVYYRTRDLAQSSACKLAMDRIRYQLYNITSPRFCLEDPSMNQDDDDDDEEQRVRSEPKLQHHLYSQRHNNDNESDLISRHNNKNDIDVLGNKQVDGLSKTASFITSNTQQSRVQIESIESLSDSVVNDIPTNSTHTTTIVESSSSNVTNPDNERNQGSVIAVSQADQDIHNMLTGMLDYSDENNDDEYEVSTDIVSFGTKSPALRLLKISYGTNDRSMNGSDEVDDDVLSSNSQKIFHHHTPYVKSTEAVIATAESWLRNNSINEKSTVTMTMTTTTKQTSKKSNGNTNDPIHDSPHRLILPRNGQSLQLFDLAKTILSSLAEAALCTPFGTTITAIEGVAKRVLDRLWRSENSLPDADVYTYFLRCLDGANRIAAIEKAEAIVEAMKNGAKYKMDLSYTLPKPNQCTYNELIQITAQIGGTSGRYPKFTDYVSDFIPDRQSFISILSSCTYPPQVESQIGGFDREFATECMVRMSELAKEQNNDQLLPDTFVYNAPLRWSGGPALWTQSRKHTRILPWDDYKQIFANGAKENIHEDNILVKQAREMDAWLQMMETESVLNKRVSPNIETYEAVIQGYLRTGTREGLDRANDLLQKAIDDSATNPSLTPRLQTFHPILASLHHSKLDGSLNRILTWIDEFERLSSNSDEPLDARLVFLKLSTLRNKQITVFRNNDGEDIEEVCAVMKSNASQCSKIVYDVIAERKRKAELGMFDEQPLDIAFFITGMDAWEYLANMGCRREDPKLTNEALSEVINLLIEFINFAKAVKPSHLGTLRDTDLLNAQFEHMVTNAPVFFTPVVKLLAVHHSVNDRPEIILLVEKMTRLIGEFEEVDTHAMRKGDTMESDQAKRFVTPETKTPLGVPNDHFNYQMKNYFSSKHMSTARHKFVMEVVRFLEKVSEEDTTDINVNDVVRLCHLMKDMTLERKHQLNRSVDTILHRLHTNFTKELSIFTSSNGGKQSKTQKTQKNSTANNNTGSTDTMEPVGETVTKQLKNSSMQQQHRRRRHSSSSNNVNDNKYHRNQKRTNTGVKKINGAM